MAMKQPHQRTIVNRALKNAFISSFVFFKFDKRRYLIGSALSFDLAFPQRVFIYFPKISLFKSSHRRRSVKKGVLGNFKKFTGKHMCYSHLQLY